ncbi:MAG: helix-turn-helix transcriptional regulator [Bacteroidia bacterium]|nr:helix-turn-helix transcriptional regulator [Bacteroidia bacterium]
MSAENFCKQMPMVCDIEKAYPSHIIPSLNIVIHSASPKQEEMRLHQLAAEVGGKLVMEENENAGDEKSNLTYTENIILALLLQGLTCKQAGEKLFVSTATVEDHKKNIYKNLDVHSRAELFRKFNHRPEEDVMPY